MSARTINLHDLFFFALFSPLFDIQLLCLLRRTGERSLSKSSKKKKRQKTELQFRLPKESSALKKITIIGDS